MVRLRADSARILNEPAFQQMLTMERHRCERTGVSFALALLDITQSAAANNPAIAERVADSLASTVRLTDATGWYQRNSTVGILLTGLKTPNRAHVREVVFERFHRSLCQVLNSGDAGKVQMSLHFFPEEVEGQEPVARVNDVLYPTLHHPTPVQVLCAAIKRLVDILGSASALLILSPLFILISVLIKLTSDGPVLFRQKRIGRNGEEFTFLKFRSMVVNNDSAVHRQYTHALIRNKAANPDGTYKIKNDSRVTPIGRFLRKTSLDEIPQFLNVLVGQMSLVGPRPPISYEVECYDTWHRRRIWEAKPGLTGLWQVSGRSTTSFDEMVRLDLQYVRSQSLRLDFVILLKTPLAVLRGHGAY